MMMQEKYFCNALAQVEGSKVIVPPVGLFCFSSWNGLGQKEP